LNGDKETIWLAIGFLGQALFSARFVVQWGEREKKAYSLLLSDM
jgi:lipid-A-disaccharide synthase-like uncharacterized protein